MAESFIKILFACVLILHASTQADQVSFSTTDDWKAWDHPNGAIEIDASGYIKPMAVRKNIDAIKNARQFGGGIRAVGSNPTNARLVMDGDYSTGWAPDFSRPSDDWWIEIDLGRLVTAEQIRLHFAEDAPPMEFFSVLIASGEQFFTNALVPIPETLVYGTSQTFGFNKNQVVTLDAEHVQVSVIRINISQVTPNARLSEVEIRTVGDNIALGTIERGGSIELITDLQSVLEGGQNMADGNIVTNWSLNTLHQTVTGKDIFNRIIFDLGAHYWIDQLRIVGEPMGSPPSRRSQNGNFFWYQVLASDGSLAPDGSLRWQEVAFRPTAPENTTEKRNFDHTFPLQKIRYLQHYFPSTEGGTIHQDGGTHSPYATFGYVSEYQIYGDGYPGELYLKSPIVDLGGAKGLTSIEWIADMPMGTRIEVRTRTGDDVEQNYTYYDKNGKVVTASRYKKLIPSFRGAIDTSIAVSENWSLWSEPYNSSGELFKSPSPRRYAQMDIRLLSENPDLAPKLSKLQINIDDPLAQKTRGEIFPNKVNAGLEETFSYFIEPTFNSRSKGFDQLSLKSSVPMHFLNIKIGNEVIPVDVTENENGFSIMLPQKVRRTGIITINFRSTIYQNLTRFEAFLGNSDLGQGVRQYVDEGNAVEDIESESISVALPVNNYIISNLSISTEVLTPNGDGISDELLIEFDALKLFVPRPIQVQIFDLAGTNVRNLSYDWGTADRYSFTWDGFDAKNRLVPPGTYLMQVKVDGDSQDGTEQHIVAVVY
jgi:hypothetical protein